MSGPPASPTPAPPALPSPDQDLVEPLTVAGSLVATALSLLCVWRLVHKAKSKNDIALGWDRVQHGLLTALPGFVIAVLDVYSDLHLYNDLTSEQQTSTSGTLILMFVAFSSIFIGLKLVFDALYVSNGWKPLEQCGCDNKEARWSTTVFLGGLSALLYLFLDDVPQLYLMGELGRLNYDTSASARRRATRSAQPPVPCPAHR